MKTIAILLALFCFFISIHAEEAPDLPARYIVDILSSDPQYSKLILTIQRSGLLEFVNGLENITFIAATNDAFNEEDQFVRISQSDLQRYIIDELVFSEDIEGPRILSTLYHGSDSYPNLQSPILVDEQDGFYIIDGATVVDKDIYASGQNCIVNGIDQFLIPKQDLCDYFDNYTNQHDIPQPFVSFSTLMSQDGFCHAHKYSNKTALIPFDDSFIYDDVELNYLLSSEGQEDRLIFVNNFFLYGLNGGLIGNESIATTNMNNEIVELTTDMAGYELIVNDDVKSFYSNYVVSDAVINLFDSVIFDESSFPLITSRKYLVGLNQSFFISELEYRKLSYLIDDLSIQQTIFVYVTPAEDVFGVESNRGRSSLLYTFVDGNDFDFSHSQLVDSKYCSSTVIGHCHRLKVKVNSNSKNSQISINDEAKVISPRYEIGNTTIYLIDEPLSTPSNLIKSVSPSLKCTRSLQYLNLFDLLDFLPNGGQGYTVFLPTTSAWTDLDLTLDYLISHPDALEHVLGSLIINGLIYDDYYGSKQIFKTLYGESLEISKMTDTLFFNHSMLDISFDSEILFHEGVAHPIDKVPFPNSLEIDMEQLINTIDPDSQFSDLLKVVGLYDLINDDNYSFIVPTSKSLNWENSTNSFSDLIYLETLLRLHILPGNSVDMLLRCEDSIPTLLNGTHLSCRETSGSYMLQIQEGNDHEVRVLRKGFTTSIYKNGLFLVDRPISPKWLEKPIYDHPIHLHLPFVAVLTGAIIGMIFLISVLSCCFLYVTNSTKKLSNTEQANEDVERDPLLSENGRLPISRNSSHYGALNSGTVVGDHTFFTPKSHHSRVLGHGSSSEDENVVPGFSENNYSAHSSSKPISFNNNSR